jgi:hypothetical protein
MSSNLGPLTPKALQEIQRRWPLLDWPALEFAVGLLMARRGSASSPPKEVVKELTHVRRRAVELRAALVGLSLEAEQLLALETAGRRHENIHWLARDVLSSLDAACFASLERVVGQDGRSSRRPLHHFIRSLAELLEASEYQIDSTESGELSRLLTLILKDLGYPAQGEQRKTLSRALANRGTRSAG